MGQRHQAYLQTYNYETKTPEVVGLHHQWLYGVMVVRRLYQLLKMDDREGYSPFRGGESIELRRDAFETAYRIGADGQFTRVHALDAECDDPRKGDNNDGVTVIQIPQETNLRAKYCIMAINGIEGSANGKEAVNLMPMTIETYLEFYVPTGEQVPDEIKMMIEYINKNADVIFPDELQQIFPAMYK